MEIKDQIVSALKKSSHLGEIELVYFFGSYASGEQNQESDVDIAVLLCQSLNQEQRFSIKLLLSEELSKALKREVDLVVLNDVSSVVLPYVVTSEGELLFERDHNTYLEFELRTMSNYFDFKPFLDEYNEAYAGKP